MARLDDWSEVPIGHYLSVIREEAGLTQASLAQRVTMSAATLSRVESGDKVITEVELMAIVNAIGSAKAKDLAEYLNQDWNQLERPAFDHPDRATLWEANIALCKLNELRMDPDLKSVFVRQIDLYEIELRRHCQFLENRQHQIAFIGRIGVGKSTAICNLVDLIKKAEDKPDRQMVLESGPGGTTLCEVHVTQGPKYGIRIVPRTEDSIRRDVEDFAEYLFRITRPGDHCGPTDEDEDGDPLGISKEVVRAIRNMAGLLEERKKDESGRRITIDPAKVLALQYETVNELTIQILTRMDLLRRNRRDAWYSDDHPHPANHWLQQVFSQLNNGRNSEFTLPQLIEVIVPNPIFASRTVPIRLIDTKGIDQTAERQDLECHFYDPRTVVVLCSSFLGAPDVEIQSLLQRAQETGVRDIQLKTAILVLAHNDQALAAKYDDGANVEDQSEGYELKCDQVRLRLSQTGLSDLDIEFFNARSDAAERLRVQLLGKITRLRQSYANQLTQLSAAVDRLIENRMMAEVESVFKHVISDLSNWVNNNRTLAPVEGQIQKSLVEAIRTTRRGWASTVRAAVKRKGDWSNLDYYHHLAFGVRKLAVLRIGGIVGKFRVIVHNFLENAELAPAHEFLERILDTIDAVIDEALNRIQMAGREAFMQTLEQDMMFWMNCNNTGGRGYCKQISETTDEQIDANCEETHRLVRKLIEDEWAMIVAMLDRTLQLKDTVASV